MPGGNKKVTHTQTILQLSPAGLFKYVWPFCYHQALRVNRMLCYFSKLSLKILPCFLELKFCKNYKKMEIALIFKEFPRPGQ